MVDPGQPQSFFFTYQKSDSKDLLQGDLFAKTREVEDLIRDVHPYYLKDDYTHFITLTQSCDLVRRKAKPCNSRYITIAAVRPLDLLIRRELEKYQDEFDKAGMVCSNKSRFLMIQFLGRLLNNNEPEYFYLHAEPALNFSEPHCAFLRLSISLKSELHYNTLFAARVLSLNEVFQAKLGWLVGNMYSRVGTDEWVPTVELESDFERRIKGLLKTVCIWVDEKKLVLAKKSVPPDINMTSLETIRQHIESIKVPSATELVINAVLDELTILSKVADPEEAKRIGNRLRNNAIFSAYTKSAS
jgi:hypothetical protein